MPVGFSVDEIGVFGELPPLCLAEKQVGGLWQRVLDDAGELADGWHGGSPKAQWASSHQKPPHAEFQDQSLQPQSLRVKTMIAPQHLALVT